MSTPLSRLETLWLCEAIRLREEHTGPLEDSHINRHVISQTQGFAARLEARAQRLAERDGQAQALRHYRQGARLALWLLLVAALFSGAALALTALGTTGGTVNVFWVLGSLLGLNWLSLFAWIVTTVLWQEHSTTLGRLWIWLSEKLARDAKAAHLTPALMLLLERKRLFKWLLGSFSHGLWLVATLASCVLLVVMLSTRQYGFVWETTLLSGHDFLAITHALGALPTVLGFSMPSDEAILLSGSQSLNDANARQAWASWLIGVMLIWGVLPRALLWFMCQVKSQRSINALTLDLDAPGYALLRERLSPLSQTLAVTDAAPDALPDAPSGHHARAFKGSVVVGVELDKEALWPPEEVAWLSNKGIIESREERSHLLDALSIQPAQFLCVVCDPNRSPDRGTLHFLTELSYSAEHVYIWLKPTVAQVDTDRLNDWQDALTERGFKHGTHAPEHQ